MNKKEVIDRIIKEKLTLKLLVAKYRDDKEIIFEIIKRSHSPYLYEIGEKLRGDKEVVLKLFKSKSDFAHISPVLREDVDFVSQLLKKDIKIFSFLSENILSNRDFILSFLDNKEAISNYHNESDYESLYHYLPEKFRNDREIILKFLESDNSFFKQLSLEYRGDKNLVMKLVKNNSAILEHCSDELKDDKDVVLAAMGRYFHEFYCISSRLKNDKEIVLKALENDMYVYSKISQDLKDDKEIIFKLISSSNNCSQLVNLSEKYSLDKEIIDFAINKDNKNIYYFPIEVKNNVDVLKKIRTEILLEDKFINDIQTVEVMSHIIQRIIGTNMNNRFVNTLLVKCEDIPEYNSFLEKELKDYVSYAELLNDKPNILEELFNQVEKEIMLNQIEKTNNKSRKIKF